MNNNRLYLSTGSTLLNLACSDSPFGGLLAGKYHSLVGPSDSGKTWLMMSLFAEACRNDKFKDHKLIYDPTEDGAGMDLAHYFGQAVEDRVQEPEHGISEYLDEFYHNVTDALDEGPCIYVVDSLDALDPIADDKDFEENKKKIRKAIAEGKDPTGLKGDYGTNRAKMNSRNLRKLMVRLAGSESLVVVVSQERDNPTAVAFTSGKTYAGGRAIKFYCGTQIWTSSTETLKKKVTKRSVETTVEMGIMCKCRVVKNRDTGKKRAVTFPIFHRYGIDDTISCIDYLTGKKHWRKTKGVVDATDLGLTGTRMALAREIEDKGLVQQLRSVVGDVWDEIEEACELPRSRRYT